MKNLIFIESVRSISIDPFNTNIIFCGTSINGVFVSYDSGLQWDEINTNLTWLAKRIWKITLNPNNSNEVFIGTGIGLYKSTNQSFNWQIKNIGFLSGSSFLNVLESESGIIIYSGIQGIFRSYINESCWDYVGLHSTTSLFVDNSNSDILFSAVYGIGIESQLYKSENGGITWNYTGLSSPVLISAITSDPINSNIIYVGGFAKSYDGGDNWVFTDTPDGHTYCLIVSNYNPQQIYVGTTMGFFNSNDGGNSWSMTGLSDKNVISIAIDHQDSNVIYAGTIEGEIYKSIDNGINWFEINEFLPDFSVNSILIHPDNNDQLYIGTRGVVFTKV